MPFSIRKLTTLQLVACSLLLLAAFTGLATSGRLVAETEEQSCRCRTRACYSCADQATRTKAGSGSCDITSHRV